MSEVDVLASWRVEEQEQPEGWSFADLDGRMRTGPTPWDFAALCLEELGRLALHRESAGGEVALTMTRFWLRAVRPDSSPGGTAR